MRRRYDIICMLKKIIIKTWHTIDATFLNGQGQLLLTQETGDNDTYDSGLWNGPKLLFSNHSDL